MLINSIEELDNMRNDLTGEYRLARDLDFNADASYDNPANKATYTTGVGWNPIQNFYGQFDGNNKTISNLFINRPALQAVGLFGSAYDTFICKNLTIADANVTGWEGVGILCGMNYGEVTKVNVSGTVVGEDYTGGLSGGGSEGNISCCSANVSVTGNNYVGGLIGLNVWAYIETSHSEGNVSGLAYIGGLIGGHFTTNITNCYSHANVTGFYAVAGFAGVSVDAPCVITNSYSTGAVSGSMLVSGFIAVNFGFIEHCFWDTETSGQPLSTGGTGKTTAEMKDINTYLAEFWDIADLSTWTDETWIIDASYPYFGCSYIEPVAEPAKCLESLLQNRNPLESKEEEILDSINIDVNKLEGVEKITFASISKQQTSLKSILIYIKKSLKKDKKKLESEYEEL